MGLLLLLLACACGQRNGRTDQRGEERAGPDGRDKGVGND
jgi:hypothetical protein